MKINPKLSDEPVMLAKKVQKQKENHFEDLSKKLSILGSKMIIKSLDLIMNGKAKFIPQNESNASYAKKINKDEGQINWNENASDLIGKINGLFPVPGAFFNFDGERYKILKAEIGNGIGKVGEVISDNLEIVCGNNQSIKILEIQRQGKKPQKVGEFMLGSKIKKGLKILNV